MTSESPTSEFAEGPGSWALRNFLEIGLPHTRFHHRFTHRFTPCKKPMPLSRLHVLELVPVDLFQLLVSPNIPTPNSHPTKRDFHSWKKFSHGTAQHLSLEGWECFSPWLSRFSMAFRVWGDENITNYSDVTKIFSDSKMSNFRMCVLVKKSFYAFDFCVFWHVLMSFIVLMLSCGDGFPMFP